MTNQETKEELQSQLEVTSLAAILTIRNLKHQKKTLQEENDQLRKLLAALCYAHPTNTLTIYDQDLRDVRSDTTLHSEHDTRERKTTVWVTDNQTRSHH